MANLLRIDPTRTAGKVRELTLVLRQGFAYLGAVAEAALEGFAGLAPTLPLLEEGVEEDARAVLLKAYRQGVRRAYNDARKVHACARGGPLLDYHVRARGILERKLGTNARRESKAKMPQITGVTGDVGSKVMAAVRAGEAKGHAPKTIAARLMKEAGLTPGRALRIARTEVIRIHAEGQLDAFEAMGVDGVRVMAEWVDTPDSKLCPHCKALGGKVLSVKQARGLIPLHPCCRCAWSPVVKDEPKGRRGRKVKNEVRVGAWYCDRCDGTGEAIGSDRPFEYSGPGTYPGPCPKCRGRCVGNAITGENGVITRARAVAFGPIADFPEVRQRASWDCGPACLLAVLEYFGAGNRTLEDLDRLAGANGRDGTPPVSVMSAAWGLGLVPTLFKDGPHCETLLHHVEAGRPVMCAVQAGHPLPSPRETPEARSAGHWVVVTGFSPVSGRVTLMDPLEDTEVTEPLYMFMDRWYDIDADGKPWRRLGIAFRRGD